MALLADFTKLVKPSPGRLRPYPGNSIAPDPSFLINYFSAIIIYLNFDGFPSSLISTSKDKLWSHFFIHIFS
jgi:oligoribonuclease (3'-5' exoribonuclease)